MKKTPLHEERINLFRIKTNHLVMFCFVFALTFLFYMRAAAINFEKVNNNASHREVPMGSPGITRAQVSGQVTTQTGEPLAGVSVKVKDGSQGTSTGTDGRYSINVPDNGVLIFSFIGYESQEIAVGTRTTLDIILVQGSQLLGDVVVTALGVQKKSKAITYTVQQIKGDELNIVPQTNFMNSLSGKAAGVSITSSGSGIGGSVKVLMRGNKSIQGNNQPLYVIDGIPLINNSREAVPSTFEGRDGGDGISNLNPDDIESMSILKGASAAALYGSAAANGVILITTKQGKNGAAKMVYSSGFTLDKVAFIPEMQYSYSQTSPGSEYSWGSPVTKAPANVSENKIKDFFKTGNTWTNAIAFSSGTEKIQSYLSYSNTNGNGVIPNNDLSRHNFDIHETGRFLNDRLKIDVNANLIRQTLNNSPNLGLLSPVMYLYAFPRGLDYDQYKNPVVYDPIRKLNIQNWYAPSGSGAAMSPFWLTEYNQYKTTTKRVILKIAAKYDLSKSLDFQVRGNVDQLNDVNSSKWFVGGPVARAGLNGQYGINYMNYTQYYGDAILNFRKTLGKIQFNGLLGSSITDLQNDGMGLNSNALFIPNVFTAQNIDLSSTNTQAYSAPASHSQLQAVFGDVNISYDDWLFLNVTGRNDWSSNLSFTPNGSYFYPFVGLSGVLNNVLNFPEVISLAKIRGSYAMVGNSVPIYVTNPLNHIGVGGNIVFNTTAPFTDLKPEKTKSLELGTEWRFFQDQFTVDFTYYKTNSTNQFFTIIVPPGTGFSSRFINAGNIQNSGIELMLGYSTRAKSTLGWSSALNLSINKNTVKELAPGIENFALAADNNLFYSILKPGGSYGDIYGFGLQRDSLSGKVIFEQNGTSYKALVQQGEPRFLGNPNPKFQLGWSNNFSYKNVTFHVLVDGKFGGKVFSGTERMLDLFGVSKTSGIARDNGGVTVDGMLADGTPVTKVDAYDWYYGNAAAKVNALYMYDATVIKVREVSIGYTLPQSVTGQGFVKNIRLSLIGRNLAYLYRPAPFDPDLTYSTGNSFAGVDVFNMPATRSFGLNLNVTF